MDMNKKVIEGGWLQVKGQLREGWGFLLKDGDEVVLGRREQFNGRVLARKGLRESNKKAEAGAANNIEQRMERLTRKLSNDQDHPRG